MIKITFRTSLLVLLVAVHSCSFTPQKHVGTWEGTDHKGAPIGITFYNNDAVKITQDGKTVVDSRNRLRDADGAILNLQYEILYDESPALLYFIIYKNRKKADEFRFAIDFLSDNEITLTKVNDEYDEMMLELGEKVPIYASLKRVNK